MTEVKANRFMDAFSAPSHQEFSGSTVVKKMALNGSMGFLGGLFLRVNPLLTAVCPLTYNISHLFMSKVTHELNEALVKAEKACGFKKLVFLNEIGEGIINNGVSLFVTMKIANSYGHDFGIPHTFIYTSVIPTLTAVSILAAAEAIKAASGISSAVDTNESSMKTEMTVTKHSVKAENPVSQPSA